MVSVHPGGDIVLYHEHTRSQEQEQQEQNPEIQRPGMGTNRSTDPYCTVWYSTIQWAADASALVDRPGCCVLFLFCRCVYSFETAGPLTFLRSTSLQALAQALAFGSS